MIPQLLVVLWLFQTTPSPRKDAITVTAEAGQQQNLDRVPQSINLLTSTEIAQRALPTLASGFREQVGVEVQYTATFMGGIFVRGLTGNKIAIYRDGIRYSNSTGRGGVNTFFNLLEPGGIEQVEILRGPNSGQYGSDSLGGVLHILSRRPDPLAPRLELLPYYSSAAHAFGNSFTLVQSSSRGGIVLHGNGQRSGTLRTGQALDSRSALTRFLNLPSTLAYTRQPDSAFTQYGGSLHAQYRSTTIHYERNQQDGANRTDQLLGGDGAYRAAVANIMGDFAYLRHELSRTAGFDLISASLSYSALREERINQSNPAAPLQRQYERTRTWGLQAQAARRLLSNDLYFGFESWFDKLRSPAQNTLPRIFDGAAYRSYGLYAQDTTELFHSRLRLSGSLRWGGSRLESLSVTALTGRIGAVLRTTSWLSLHSWFSRGFRAPSLTDLGSRGLQGNGTFEALPPAGLAPEFTNNIDAGLRIHTRPVTVRLTGFASRLSNLIVSQTLLLPPGATGQLLSGERIVSQRPDGAVFVALSNSPVTAKRNLDRAHFRGLEQQLDWHLPRSLTLGQGFTWLRADDPATGQVPNVEGLYPPAMGFIRLRYNPTGKRFWFEPYVTLNARQSRLSELARNDRRIGAPRTRSQIAAFYNNHPALAALSPWSLPQLQNLLGGTALFHAIPGYCLTGLRGGYTFSDRLSIFADASNLTDKNYRGMASGVDGPGRGLSIQIRLRL